MTFVPCTSRTLALSHRSCPLNTTYIDTVVDQFEQCFSTNLTRPLRLLVQSDVVSQSGLLTAMASFTTSTGIGVSLEVVNQSIAARQAVEELQLNPQAKDGWILDGSGITTLAFQPNPVVMDLTAWVGINAAVQFNGYAPFWQGLGPSFGGSVLSLPMQGRNLLLFYR